MTLPVHVVGGVFLTGVACALGGISILNPLSFAFVVVGSVLPDIDHTKSPVGRLCPPLSRYLNRAHGHRNLTHSAVFTTALCLVFGMIEKTFLDSTELTTVFILAYSSHILLDMFTMHGVGLFYPFVRNMAVLPGNAKYRVKTGNPRTEAGIFIAFCVVTIGCLPLLQQGFWTSYNRTFSTPDHLVSEFEKSSDLLRVSYQVRRGSREENGSGLVVDPGPSVITLFQNGRFRRIDTKNEKVVSITPEHTGESLFFKTVRFSEIAVDSLHRLAGELKVLRGEVSGSREFFAMGESRKSWKVNLLVGLRVRDDYEEKEFVKPEYQEPSRVQSMRKQIARLEADQLRSSESVSSAELKRSNLESRVLAAGDLVERQRLQRELSKVAIPVFRDQSARIAELRSSIRELITDSENEFEGLIHAEKEEWERSKSGELKLSGWLEIVEFKS